MKTKSKVIELFVYCDIRNTWDFVSVTMRSKTCREAKARFLLTRPDLNPGRVKASFRRDD